MITKGDLPLDIKWSLNGQLVVNGENGLTVVRMSPRLSSLSIDSINGKHRGIFKCMSSNSAGTTEHSTDLKVNGVIFFAKTKYKIQNTKLQNIAYFNIFRLFYD